MSAAPVGPAGPTFADWLRAKWGRRQRSMLAWSAARTVAFVVTVLGWAFGAYYGLIALPDLADIGGLAAVVIGIVIVGALIAGVLQPYKWLQVTMVLAAIVIGAVAGALGLFASLVSSSFWGLAGGLVALIATFFVARWLCRVPRPSTEVAP